MPEQSFFFSTITLIYQSNFTKKYKLNFDIKSVHAKTCGVVVVTDRTDFRNENGGGCEQQ